MFTILLFERINIKANSEYPIIPLKKWGFKEEGSLSARFTEVESPSLALALCNHTEYVNFIRRIITDCNTLNQICNASEIKAVEENTVDFNIKVTKRDSYYPIIYACKGGISKYTAELNFSNPDSKLSTVEIPCLYTKPIMVALFGIAVIFWYINWFMNFKGSSILHKFYTVAFTVALANIIVDCIYYYHSNKSDSRTAIFNATNVFSFLFMSLVIMAYAFVALGYNLIHDNYTYLDVFKIVIFSLVMTGAFYIYRYVNGFILQLIFIVIFGILLYFFFKLVYDGSKNTLLYIYAHMYVIAERGINPLTTPLKRKLRILNTINYVIMTFLILTIIFTLFYGVFGISVWVYELLTDIINLALVCGAVYLFKLDTSHSGYQAISETLEVQEFTKEDLRNLDFDAVLARATNEWDGQTLLPPMPRIVETPTVHQHDNEEVFVRPQTEEPYDIEVQAPDVAPAINPYLDDVDPAARP